MTVGTVLGAPATIRLENVGRARVGPAHGEKNSMKIIKWLAGIGAALVVAVGIGGYLLVSSLDLDQVRTLVQDQAKAATGRELTLAGPIELGISWTPSVTVGQVSFANAEWGSRPAMATLERLELEIALMPLLSGDIQINRIVLVGADVLLEKDASGNVNWSFGGAETSAEADTSAGPSVMPRIDTVRIESSRVAYRDVATGEELVVVVERAEVSPAGAGLALDVTGSYGGAPFALAGEIGGLAQLTAAEPYPVRLAGTVAGTEVKLDGAIADPAGAASPKIAFQVSGADVAALAPLAGTGLPTTGAYQVSGTLSNAGTAWTIDGLAAKVDGSDAAGSLTIDVGGARTRIAVALTSTAFALADVGLAGASAQAAESPYVFDETPLPVEGLRAIDAEGTLAIAKFLPAEGTELADVALTFTLDDGVLTLDPFAATYSGGVASGRLVVDGAKPTPAFAVAATVDNLDFGRLLAAAGVSDGVQGTLDAAVAVTGQGDSPRAIAKTLDGTAEVVADRGVINNQALAVVASGLFDVLGPLSGEQDQTTLNCGVARFDVTGGVATSRSLLVDSTTFSLAGSGTVDLRDESLDLHFDTATRQTALVSLAVPFNVTGTLKDPTVAPDPLGTAAAAAVLAGAAVNPVAVLGALVAVEQVDEDAPNGCVAVEQQASESGAFGLPALDQATESVQDVLEGVTEDAGEAASGAGEVLEDAAESITEGIQNLFGN